MSPTSIPSTPMMRVLAGAICSGTSVSITGKIGATKTKTFTRGLGDEATAEELAARQINRALGAWDMHVEVVTTSTREPMDFQGVMVEKDGLTAYAPLAWADRCNRAGAAGKRSLALFDELDTAEIPAMKAAMRTLQEKVVGELPLHERHVNIALGNGTHSGLDTVPLPATIANRMIHLTWHLDHETFLTGLSTGFTHMDYPPMKALLGQDQPGHLVDLNAAVVAYLRANPGSLDPDAPSDPINAGLAWPSPRSWTNAALVASHLRRDDEEGIALAFGSAVGSVEAGMFMAFRRDASIPAAAEVAADPDALQWEKVRPDVAFAILHAQYARALNAQTTASKTETSKVWDQAIETVLVAARRGHSGVALAVANLLMNMDGADRSPEMISDLKEVFGDLLEHLTFGVRRDARRHSRRANHL